MDSKIEKRGGPRPGSGRPKKNADGPRVTFSVMVAPITRQRITALRSKGVLLGEAVDALVADLAKQHGID